MVKKPTSPLFFSEGTFITVHRFSAWYIHKRNKITSDVWCFTKREGLTKRMKAWSAWSQLREPPLKSWIHGWCIKLVLIETFKYLFVPVAEPVCALHKRYAIITAHNSSCGKVMFSQACVKNSVHMAGHACHTCPQACTPPRACMLPIRYYEMWSMSRRYASYWNAFLFDNLTITKNKIQSKTSKELSIEMKAFLVDLTETLKF